MKLVAQSAYVTLNLMIVEQFNSICKYYLGTFIILCMG